MCGTDKVRERNSPTPTGASAEPAGVTRGPRPPSDADPRTDTVAAAAHLVGVLWVTQSQGATVKERPASGWKPPYDYLLENPPLGLAVQRQGDELFLVTAPEVNAAVERYLDHPRPVALSRAAPEVLAIVAYRHPIARAGIERIRGSNGESTLDTLLCASS